MSSKTLPTASAMTLQRWVTDDITQTRDVEESMQYLSQPELSLTPEGDYEVSYLDGTDSQDIRTFVITGVEQVGGVTTGIIEGTDSSVSIRAVTASDAVDLSPAGVPQPLDVVEAEVGRGGGMLAGEVDAAVAGDNSVVTLVLDTGLGLYVRYSGDWQLLPTTSNSLDGLALHPVAPAALDVFDAADAAAQTISVFDLPRSIDNYYTDAADQEEAEETAGGPTVAAIDSVYDLSNSLRTGRGANGWYTEKRRRAMVPDGGQRDTGPQVLTAAAEYLMALREGINVDPTGLIRRDIIRRARSAGVLQDPVILAALDWRDWLHPRDRGGKFIHKSGLVDVYPSPTAKEGAQRGRVREMSQRGVLVDIVNPDTKKPTGESVLVSPKLLEEFKAKADLDPNAPDAAPPGEGGEGKTGTLADTFP